jgi:D-inositol-3-phosphate glycosyltransferase
MRTSVRRLRCRVVAHSTVVRDRTAEAFGLDAVDIDLVPLGVDTERYQPSAIARTDVRRLLGISADRPLVVWAGRVDTLKRPLDAVAVGRAVQRLHPDAVLLMAGGGSLLDKVRAAGAGEEWLRVPGYVDDLAALLAAADVYLSTSAYEGFGLSVAEALACGVPAVSTRAGGVIDVVDDRVTGRLVPVGDIDALAAAVCELLDDEGLRRQMGAAARHAAVTRMSTEAMAAGYTRVYRRLANGGR